MPNALAHSAWFRSTKPDLHPNRDRRSSEHCAEAAVHVALIEKAVLKGDIAHGQLGAAKHRGSSFDAPPARCFADPFASCTAVGSREVGRMKVEHPCNSPSVRLRVGAERVRDVIEPTRLPEGLSRECSIEELGRRIADRRFGYTG